MDIGQRIMVIQYPFFHLVISSFFLKCFYSLCAEYCCYYKLFKNLHSSFFVPQTYVPYWMSGKKKVESSKLRDFLVLCLALGNLKRVNRVDFGQIIFKVFPGHVLIQSFHSFRSYQVPWFHLLHHFLYRLLHTLVLLPYVRLSPSFLCPLCFLISVATPL